MKNPEARPEYKGTPPPEATTSRVRLLPSKPIQTDPILTPPADGAPDPPSDDDEKGVVEHLLEIAGACELWTDQDERPCATWEIDGSRYNALVNGREFRSYLSATFYAMTEMGVSDFAMKTALCTIEARALHEGITHRTALRLGGFDGKVYLDLGDRDRTVIEVSDQGWKVLTTACPVRFLRRQGMQSLPIPQPSTSIEHLWKYVNVAAEDRVLFAGFVLQCLNPSGGYFGLNVYGGAGTAKTTATWIARSLIDPNKAMSASFPSDARELFISASAQRVLAFDNVSNLSPEQSDWLCRVSTGDSHRSRTLYTDDSETILSARNPWVVNGIPNVVSRGDLLERAISIELLPISRDARITEDALKAQFTADLPVILGGFLNAVSASLRRLAWARDCYAGLLPRMAQAGEWICAGEQALGFAQGSFILRHITMSAKASHDSIDGDEVATALVEMVREKGDFTEVIGMLRKDLITALEWKEGRDRFHPLSNARAFSAYLTRLTPTFLAAQEIKIFKEPVRSSKGALVTFSCKK